MPELLWVVGCLRLQVGLLALGRGFNHALKVRPNLANM